MKMVCSSEKPETIRAFLFYRRIKTSTVPKLRRSVVHPVEPINRYSLRHSRSYQIGYLHSADSVNGQMVHSSHLN